LPHQRVIAEGNGVDEERRLCYVGVTRAQDTLTLSLCKSRTKWGKPRPSIPSRFLLEMRGETERALRAAEAAEAQVAQNRQAAEQAQAEAAAKAAKAAKASKKRAAKRTTRGADRPSARAKAGSA
jgi:DNA helicase II / ATP-dependent DNA helicase PcrA